MDRHCGCAANELVTCISSETWPCIVVQNTTRNLPMHHYSETDVVKDERQPCLHFTFFDPSMARTINNSF
jgi:hypothetical protein